MLYTEKIKSTQVGHLARFYVFQRETETLNISYSVKKAPIERVNLKRVMALIESEESRTTKNAFGHIHYAVHTRDILRQTQIKIRHFIHLFYFDEWLRMRATYKI